MRVAAFAGCLGIGLLVHEAAAQRPVPQLGVLGGVSYEQGSNNYGAQLAIVFALTPENRPLSFRIQGHAAWSPSQTHGVLSPVPTEAGGPSGYIVSSGTSRQIGGGLAAILHARPRSRISPYLIVGYGIAERWQEGATRAYDGNGTLAGPPNPWPHSYTSGDFDGGAGIRARMGGQILRLEATRSANRTVLSLGIGKPF